jgi:hypothetical protein
VSIRSYAAGHKVPVGIVSFVALGLLVFGIVWFQPQKLIQEKTVKESAPAATASTPGATPAAVDVASGSFRSLEHETTGTARLIRLADGSHILRFENLDTSNGPDLRVYLSELPANLGLRDYGERYLELGHGLKGNRGDQNYVIPKGTDVTKFKSAVIWCVRFKVGFGVAPLNA